MWKNEFASDGRNIQTPQMPAYLTVLREALIRILGQDAEKDDVENTEEKNLRNTDQQSLNNEKNKYQNFVERCREHEFDEGILDLMREVADEQGKDILA